MVYRQPIVLIPQSLLISPCQRFDFKSKPEVINGNMSVNTLVEAQLHNDSCLKKYSILLTKQREFKASMEKIYGSTTTNIGGELKD